MSRIHEALQRAYRERGKLPASENNHVAELTIASAARGAAGRQARIGLGKHCAASMEAIYRFLSYAHRPRRRRRAVSPPALARLPGTLEAPLKTILIASGMPSEGKSFVAANLAMSMARNSVNNILLIDGDLRRPTLHNLLGAPDTPGLSDYLARHRWI